MWCFNIFTVLSREQPVKQTIQGPVMRKMFPFDDVIMHAHPLPERSTPPVDVTQEALVPSRQRRCPVCRAETETHLEVVSVPRDEAPTVPMLLDVKKLLEYLE